MSFLLAIVVGVFSSLVASSLFLWSMFHFRPTIDISPYITREQGTDGTTIYKVKFVNKSKRALTNVRLNLSLATLKTISGGTLRDHEVLIEKQIYEIDRYNKKDKEAHYAARISIPNDLDALWTDEDNMYLRFLVSATDSLSGFGKVFSQEFHPKRTALKDGTHAFGTSLDVI